MRSGVSLPSSALSTVSHRWGLAARGDLGLRLRTSARFRHERPPLRVVATHRFSALALASLAPDAERLAEVLEVVEEQVRDLRQRLDHLRRLEVPAGAARLQRDLEIHQLTSRLHVLRRLGNE